MMEDVKNPYQAPNVEVEPEVEESLQQTLSPYGSLQDHSSLATVCKIVLGLGIALDVAYSAYSIKLAADLDKGENPLYTHAGEESLGYKVYDGLMTGSIAVFVVSVIVICMWTVRSMKNAWAVPGNEGQPRPSTTPGWAAGYYFVPILNWFRPYGAMKEIWNYTFHFQRPTGMLLAWWLTWIFGNLSSYGSNNSEPATLEEMASMLRVELVGTGLLVVSGVLLILIISRVTKKQVEYYTRCAKNLPQAFRPLSAKDKVSLGR